MCVCVCVCVFVYGSCFRTLAVLFINQFSAARVAFSLEDQDSGAHNAKEGRALEREDSAVTRVYGWRVVCQCTYACVCV